MPVGNRRPGRLLVGVLAVGVVLAGSISASASLAAPPHHAAYGPRGGPHTSDAAGCMVAVPHGSGPPPNGGHAVRVTGAAPSSAGVAPNGGNAVPVTSGDAPAGAPNPPPPTC